MRPVYPSKTFPNHYSIVTIWLTAMYQGLKSATFFWPASDVDVNGTFPNFYRIYNGSVPFEERVVTFLSWLQLTEKQKPHFYTLYLEEPDSSGHRYGPGSSEVILALQRVDKIVGFLMDGLKQMNLHNCINIILLADHGMEAASCRKAAYLNTYLDDVENLFVVPGPAARLRPQKVPDEYYSFDYEGIVQKLTCLAPDQPFKVYMKQLLPKRFHYAKNDRIEPVHFYMDQQWQLARSKFDPPDILEYTCILVMLLGASGVDLLDLIPAPNNGTHGSLNHLLKKASYIPKHPKEESKPSSCPLTGLRTSADDPHCSCNSLGLLHIRPRINLTTSERKKIEKFSLPFGRPRVLQKKQIYCLLHNQHSVTGFSQDIKMPLWSSYTVKKHDTWNASADAISSCFHIDNRVPLNGSQTCSFYKSHPQLNYGFLFPPNLIKNERNNKYEGHFSTNIVPMYPAFQVIWNYFNTILLPTYASARNGVNVITGPVFDYDYNGVYDTSAELTRLSNYSEVPLPTHYFIVLTSCKNVSQTPLQCEGSLDVVSYIVPHRKDNNESCAASKPESLWVEKRMKFHTARVRDVELLTGLSFYHDIKQPVADILQLKTYLPTFDNV
ncbi:hypothetical protein JD844_024492 [Phrynosoma platyrhinos]|uniref:Ectonucleotide pyrophosphatase/phosphodiesterase 1 n=1 Tax=Phrynosoma platyrhinos TaxID=52577 RepID=A0ABQ7SY85_PHRPL|nr:hypothetical protein JD844_024492 [Phrynosoma platyrhinos]